MKSSKKEKLHKPLSLGKKILLVILGLAVVIGLCYLIYYMVHYMFYNEYQKYETTYDYEEGTEYKAVKEQKADVAGMELVCENDILKLYTDPETANVAVFDKRNGETIYSNPIEADNDSMANGANLNYLKSQLIVNYYNQEIKSGTYDSYSMSVEKGQYEVESIENGIRYIYNLGNYAESKTGTVPLYLTEEKMADLVSGMDEKTGESFQRYYVASDIPASDYALNGVAQKNTKTIQKIQGWLDELGWTEEEFSEQMEIAGVESSVPISFTIPLEYRLEEDGLKVSVPVSAVEERGGGKVYRIQMLRYMGAPSVAEDGYMVVPNGAGSLINFNNGKTNTANYSQYVYDIDPLSSTYTVLDKVDSAKLPLFGICREDSSVLATIEEGQSLAAITAGVSGVYTDYNYAYPTFVLRVADNLIMFGDSTNDVYVLEPDMYNVNLTVKYTLLTEEYKGYEGLANYYRNRLIEEGVLTTKQETGDIPFYYDVICGVKETGHFLGTQYLRNFAMTTFEEAGQMSDELAAKGITNQVVNLQGWFNGGYYHDATDRVNVNWRLGGKSGLEDLNEQIADNGGSLYADVAFQQVTFADDGFNYDAESSRYYGAGYVVNFGQLNPAIYRNTSGLGYFETKYDLLSPRYLPRYVESFANKVDSIELSGISLRDLGNEVHSDKKRTCIINREQALNIVTGQLAALEQTGKQLMMNAGNDYSFAYATDIINTPITDNDFFIVDADIPLYQMILHGYIDYSTELLNFYDLEDMNGIILNMIEYGASPHYVFTWEASNRMKNTGLNRYYATTYSVWQPEAIQVYEQVNEALQHVTGEVMTGHEILENGVRKVTYDNGVILYINYGEEDELADGMNIKAGSYEMEGM